MLVKIQVQNEAGDAFEFIEITGGMFKTVLKKNPEKLLEMVEEMEERLPKSIGGSNIPNSNNMSLTMMTTCGAGSR